MICSLTYIQNNIQNNKLHVKLTFIFLQCGRALNLALLLYQELGFPVMPDKVVGLATIIDFLGFIVDTLAMEIRLPDEKLITHKADDPVLEMEEELLQA